jgi:uncharacterized protein
MALSFRRFVGRVAVGALAVAVPVVLTPVAASAATTDLLISEYVEGSSFNKAIEIYNGTGAAVDLLGGGYRLELYSNGSSTVSSSLALSGVLDNGEVFVAAHASANASILAVADVTNSGTINWNGDDAIVLRKGATIIDSIGQVGVDPGTEWGTGLASTADNTLRRKTAVQAGDTNPADAFDPAVQWDGFPVDTVDGLGAYGDALPPDDAPTVTAVSPTAGSIVAVGSQVTVTFSEDVAAPASAFALSCNGAPVAFALSGGPTTFTLDPTADLPFGASCSATVTGASVSDTDTNDPPDTVAADRTWTFSTAQDVDRCALPATTIGSLQGSGDETPALGGTRTVRGVVVGDHEGPSPALRGFYVQDSGDGDAATSDGVFVFNGGNQDLVSLGDVVSVTGTAGENQGQTQISSTAVNIAVCGTGTVAPTEVALPVSSTADLEKVEGMLVTYPQDLYVTEHFQLGRFGQVTLSGGDRLDQPTNVVAPGAPAQALQAANNLRKVILDDSTQAQNPDPIVFARGGQPLSATNTLRGGDTVAGLTGVMTYTWGGNAASPNAYRVRPVTALAGAFDFEPANPRPTAREDVGGDVQVGAMNLLNLFNTFTGCTSGIGGGTTDCRGANNAVEFERQVAKTVAAVKKVDADVLGINEIENDGYGPTSSIQDLVTRLNAATAPGTYAFIDADAGTGQVNALGNDAIKVGMLYKPALVTPIGHTAALNTVAFVNGGDPAPRARPSLAQAFRVNATGGTFVADVNHFKSKGSACSAPDAGDGQGNCNAVRTRSAQELATWLASDPTGTGEADALILGDLNSYAKEDPIRTLETAGFTNLVNRFVGGDAYSYVFDGQWGYLDHALGSAGIVSQVTDVTEYHINADEPSVLDYNTEFKSPGQVAGLYAPDEFRVSDHDPIIVGLKPNSAPTVSAAFEAGSVACGTGNASLDVTFTDRDEADTHKATVAWGDGTANTVVDPATSPLSLKHTYASAGRYTATVTVTDSHGLSTTRTAVVTVEYTSSGVLAPLGSGGTAQLNSTVPVKVAYTDCDGSVPTDLDPVVTVTRNGTTHVTGTATLVKGEWKYELSTRGLAAGTYTVTVTVPETGQTDTAQLTLLRR